MGGKRKRSHKRSDAAESPNKVAKLSTDCTAAIKHPLLSAYYPTVLTLRGYILSALPATSKTRRRKISGLGEHARVVPLPLKTPAKAEKKVEHGIDDLLAKLLDTTLVGVLRRRTGEIDQSRLKDFKTFSQQVSPSTQSTLGDGLSSQSEVSQFLLNTYAYLGCTFEIMLRDESFQSQHPIQSSRHSLLLRRCYVY